ncbi:trypsin-like peptidase domain-containing protein [Xanthomarina sp. F2636L]|uniref:trypsin-like peptidase domain-containing protein n=1 Tax=Xanthomarina sp. F2636L TaxID=2996018 RepID=UPI00225DCE93|nr:trypsin-like peptidase domain-containing protein [Xanthomarina sp. F2636L]MCX7552217.1 trypsin-like peptidase domain-containing protein [Xanthomarina sp. F2636L]
MKKIATLVLVSVLGGAITLSAYKFFLENNHTNSNSQIENSTTPFPVSHVSNSSFIPENSIDFTSAAEKTIHTVVHVKNTTTGNSGQMTFEDLFYGRSPQRSQVGSGSGVIISPDGYIITNNHVIAGSNELTVTLNNNSTYNAKIIGSDNKTDIALLKIETDEDLPYTTFGDSDQARIGEWVLAVGNPFNLTSTVTAGIISAKSRDLTGGRSTQSFIQTDAAVNPGNSGGALVNSNGDLIGINTAISSQTGSYIGYSFAVPSNIARKVIEDIIEYGNVQNGVLGVTGGALNSGFAERLSVNETEGFYVDSVEENSGAFEAGLETGDIIKKIDHVKISKFSDLTGYLSTKRPDDVVKITYLRNGSLKEIPVTLARNQSYTIPKLGVVKNATKTELKKYNTPNGVKISRLGQSYSKYLRANGVQEGDIVTSINNNKVYNVEDVQEIIKNKSAYEPLRIELINSNGEVERYNFN